MPIRKIPLEKYLYYHIYNRGFEKQIIFRNKHDFKRFYQTVIRYNKVYEGIRILSYCFLPNHFHFIITSNKSGLEISDFMRKIQQSYAMYLKTNSSPDLKNRTPVFEGRFKAKYIDTDEYLQQCIHYVNFNPLKHEIVTDIFHYPWTSYHQLTREQRIQAKDTLILSELEY